MLQHTKSAVSHHFQSWIKSQIFGFITIFQNVKAQNSYQNVGFCRLCGTSCNIPVCGIRELIWIYMSPKCPYNSLSLSLSTHVLNWSWCGMMYGNEGRDLGIYRKLQPVRTGHTADHVSVCMLLVACASTHGTDMAGFMSHTHAWWHSWSTWLVAWMKCMQGDTSSPHGWPHASITCVATCHVAT